MASVTSSRRLLVDGGPRCLYEKILDELAALIKQQDHFVCLLPSEATAQQLNRDLRAAFKGVLPNQHIYSLDRWVKVWAQKSDLLPPGRSLENQLHRLSLLKHPLLKHPGDAESFLNLRRELTHHLVSSGDDLRQRLLKERSDQELRAIDDALCQLLDQSRHTLFADDPFLALCDAWQQDQLPKFADGAYSLVLWGVDDFTPLQWELWDHMLHDANAALVALDLVTGATYAHDLLYGPVKETAQAMQSRGFELEILVSQDSRRKLFLENSRESEGWPLDYLKCPHASDQSALVAALAKESMGQGLAAEDVLCVSPSPQTWQRRFELELTMAGLPVKKNQKKALKSSAAFQALHRLANFFREGCPGPEFCALLNDQNLVFAQGAFPKLASLVRQCNLQGGRGFSNLVTEFKTAITQLKRQDEGWRSPQSEKELSSIFEFMDDFSQVIAAFEQPQAIQRWQALFFSSPQFLHWRHKLSDLDHHHVESEIGQSLADTLTLRDLFKSWAGIVDDRWSWDDLCRHLNWMGCLLETMPSSSDGVALVGFLEARAMVASRVILFGFNEVSFPIPASPPWLLKAEDRQWLKQPDHQSEARRFLKRVIEMGQQVTLVVTPLDDRVSDNLVLQELFAGTHLPLRSDPPPPSRFHALRQTEIKWDRRYQAQWETGALRGKREWQRIRLEAESYAGFLGQAFAEQARDIHSQECSVSFLDTLSRCPFLYFASDLLSLQSPREFIPETDAGLRGQALHKALERFHSEDPEDLSGDRLWDCLHQAAQEFLNKDEQLSFCAHHGRGLRHDDPRTSVLSLYLDHMKDLLLKRRIVATEWAFGSASPRPPLLLSWDDREVRIKGCVDRLDQDEQGTWHVVDYKSGFPPRGRDVAEGHALQLPLYALAALQKEAEAEKVTWHVQSLRRDALESQPGLGRSGRSETEILEQIPEKVIDLVQRYSAGNFSLSDDPQRSGCQQCPTSELCRQNPKWLMDDEALR